MASFVAADFCTLFRVLQNSASVSSSMLAVGCTLKLTS